MTAAVASAVFSGLAVLLAAATLGITTKRETARAEREEKAAELQEEAAAREALAARLSLEGRPTTDQISREKGELRAYSFHVTNVGKAPMGHVQAQLLDSSGNECSEQISLPSLQPGDESTFILKVAEPGTQNPLYVHYTWVNFTEHGYEERQYLSKTAVPET